MPSKTQLLAVEMTVVASWPLNIRAPRLRGTVSFPLMLYTRDQARLLIPRSTIRGALRSVATAVGLRVARIALAEASRDPDLGRLTSCTTSAAGEEAVSPLVERHLQREENLLRWLVALSHNSDKYHCRYSWTPIPEHVEACAGNAARLLAERYGERYGLPVPGMERFARDWLLTRLCPICGLFGSHASRGRVRAFDLLASRYVLDVVGRNSIDPTTMTIMMNHFFLEVTGVVLEPLTLRLVVDSVEKGSPEALLLTLTLDTVARAGLVVGGTKTVGRGLLKPMPGRKAKVCVLESGSLSGLLSSKPGSPEELARKASLSDCRSVEAKGLAGVLAEVLGLGG